MDAVGSAYYAVFGTDSQSGAASLLAEAESALSRVAALSGSCPNCPSAVSELRYTTEDVAERLRDVRESPDFSPQELDAVESRLDHLHRLKRSTAALFRRCWSTWHAVRTSWIKSRWLTTVWPNSNSSARNSWPKPGPRERPSPQKRLRQAAETLKARIEEELRQLDMPKVRFEVAFSPKPGKLGLDETGMDEVSFLMSANVGETLKPIAKVASGGELSRIMLALKNVLAENDSIQTLIFDEVDTGVSGRAAAKVAEKMSRLSRTCQVLCVTHLAQIAAMADSHYSVHKEERGGRDIHPGGRPGPPGPQRGAGPPDRGAATCPKPFWRGQRSFAGGRGL